MDENESRMHMKKPYFHPRARIVVPYSPEESLNSDCDDVFLFALHG